MVLLTFLVGGTAYQQILGWKNEVNRVTHKVSQVVILSNVRWGIKKVQRELPENPEQAQTDWHEIYRQAMMLSDVAQKSDPANSATFSPLLQSILANPTPTATLLDSLSQNELFTLKLESLNELRDLQDQAQQVTQWVTLSMIVLGLILTAMTAYDLDRLIQQLARSRDINIRLQEEERQRIAQDLHDGVVQDLVDLKRGYAAHKVDSVIDNLRRICQNLKPQILEDLGLEAALEFLADDLRQAGIAQVSLNTAAEGLKQLPKRYELPLFRVFQELCANIKHHAQASQVQITLAYAPEDGPILSATISDNGRGFDPERKDPRKMGLTGVQERIQQLGGKIHIRSQPNQGSHFQLIVPVKPE